jgi:hypothetical protein
MLAVHACVMPCSDFASQCITDNGVMAQQSLPHERFAPVIMAFHNVLQYNVILNAF